MDLLHALARRNTAELPAKILVNMSDREYQNLLRKLRSFWRKELPILYRKAIDSIPQEIKANG